MTDLPLETIRKRSQSALAKNCNNIDLHACLDQAKGYKDLVKFHMSQSKFENHVLESAERFYKNKSTLRPTSSQTTLSRYGMRRTFSSSKITGQLNGRTSGSSQKYQTNPEVGMIAALDSKAFRISDIKCGFDDGIEEKNDLKKRMQHLKNLIVVQKNKKAKTSIRNAKLMNEAEISDHQRNKLNEQSRRNNILINEVIDQSLNLQRQLNELVNKNSNMRQKIQETKKQVQSYENTVSKKRRQLDRQRKVLQMFKQRQTVSYKEMTNKYMEMNQLKQEKAWLLNSIDLDVRNNS